MTHYVWDFPKEIFHIGSYAPRWYGLMFAIGFMASFNIMKLIFVKEGRKVDDLSSLLTHLMVGVIAGARLGHCLFYAPEEYLANPIRILMVWEGGLASHGASIGALLALWIYQRKHRDQSYMWLADRLAIGVALTASCIRIGNLFNSEILGKPSDVPWAIIFADTHDNIPRHPAMIYESLSYLMLAGVLSLLYVKTKGEKRGQMLGLMLVWVFISRFFIEFIKENQVAFENAMPINMGQILSLPFIVLGFLLLSGKLLAWCPWLNYADAPLVVEAVKETKPKEKTKAKKSLAS
ncbi:MAG: prolipoprotein diacylglyceryl transferase [Chitinophagaceae bacterium]|nr:prolipoprotein diacylglyceryl transferase [Oligoflexus sp.]